MLRPTQSAIIFVQQLGRGLRKREGKSYVTVIDFIGNYQNNFLVPVALFGDKSYVKDNLRKLVNQPEKAIIGASTIYFDRIVKEKIFESINTGKLQEKRKLVQEYLALKGKIGRIPKMMDFINHGERDPFQYVTNFKSYYEFQLLQKESISQLNTYELELLSFLSKEVLNPIRFAEIHLVKSIITREVTIEEYFELYSTETNTTILKDVFNHAIHTINGMFFTIKENKKLVKIGPCKNYKIIEINKDQIFIGESLSTLLKHEDVKSYLLDLCEYSIANLKNQSRSAYANNEFILNQKYTRKDVFRILKWEENPIAQNVGGYMIAKDKKDCALFVNYHKEEGISATTKYHDRFVSRNEFIWMSKNKRYIKSADVSTIIQQEKYGMRIPLFVKKSNFEDTDFYFLGNLSIVHNSWEEKMIKDDLNKDVSVVEMKFTLQTPVDKSIYDYLIEV
jgi:hypothetical protein